MGIGFHRFPNGKQYVFVTDAKGARIFLRNIIIISNEKNPAEIAIVREWGARSNKGTWEPPKGQMEWKEFSESGVVSGNSLSAASLTGFQRRGVLREMVEEAKIYPSEIKHLKKLPLVYQQEWEGLKNSYFAYQFWHATISNATMLEAQKRIATLVAHASDWKRILPADVTEKDAIKWWNPERDGWDAIRGEFSKKMTKLYFYSLEKVHHV